MDRTSFQLSEHARIGMVVLKVANLESMTKFYQQVIGLTVLEETATSVDLGTKTNKTLLRLEQIVDPLPLTKRTGLFHVAFLVPSRAALGEALQHYLTIKAPIDGASDHGYSEALYLTDPEGNGIEVYHDKPKEVWDIKENGEIHGITIEMDAQGVLDAATKEWSGFDEETIVGHVHLKVADLEQTEAFYTDQLGLTLKSNFGTQAKFFAAGPYHHHLGSNIWMGKHVPAMQENDLGLHYFIFVLPTKKEMQNLEDHLQKTNVPYQKDYKGRLSLIDPNGIMLKIELV
ncbi:VOC family protein [Enterococcus bulliens]